MSDQEKPKNPDRPEVTDVTRKRRTLTRADFLQIAAGAGALGITAAAVGIKPTSVLAKAPKTKIDTPTISCGPLVSDVFIEITVCAPGGTGATGLPAGFSIQWMTLADYVANGNAWYTSDDPRLCKASFSGNASDSRYSLAAGTCATVRIGDILFDNGASTNCAGDLVPCTEYVFRAFGHATNTLTRSDFTANITCKTTGCDQDLCPPADCCTLTQGYWKNHCPSTFGCPCATDATWPVSSLTLGTVSYSGCELLSILNQPPAGNGLIALAHQLIAAKLNALKNGCTLETAVAADIAAADTLIGSRVVPPVGTGYLAASATSDLVTRLNNYNTGLTGPGHCC